MAPIAHRISRWQLTPLMPRITLGGARCGKPLLPTKDVVNLVVAIGGGKSSNATSTKKMAV